MKIIRIETERLRTVQNAMQPQIKGEFVGLSVKAEIFDENSQILRSTAELITHILCIDSIDCKTPSQR